MNKEIEESFQECQIMIKEIREERIRDKEKIEQLTNKLKILRNPSKKSARDLLKAINKQNYDSTITNKGEVIVRIDKKGVLLSLNGKREKIK